MAQAPTDIFDKAPPHIDNALRSRVSAFFQAFVDKKFRAADQYVAEESKDAFFTMEKRPYLGFEIARINYSDNFAKATVVTALEVEWRTPRTGVMRVKSPTTSLWKVENGEWFWYIVPQKDWDSPWGKMNPGPDPQGPRTVLEAFKGVSPSDVLNAVKISKSTVRLSSYEPASDSVQIANGMPGDIEVQVDDPGVPGLLVKLDREILKQGETARLVFEYNPETKQPKPTRTVQVRINPTGRTFPLRLEFAVPEMVNRKK
jgi:hypothetical protein